jgi:serine/threonine-protein kinase RsbW
VSEKQILVHVLAEQCLETAASVQSLDQVHVALQQFWQISAAKQSRLSDPDWRSQFATALGEIAANIVRHAHPSPGEAGCLCLRLRLYPGRVEARFVDDGRPYPGSLSVSALPILDDLPEGGFGLALARAALDRLRYRRTGNGVNCWWLVKRFPPPAPCQETPRPPG